MFDRDGWNVLEAMDARVVWNVLLKADVFKLTDLRGSPLCFSEGNCKAIEMNLLLMSLKNISLKTIGLAS